jgi:3-dehydroquinate synthase
LSNGEIGKIDAIIGIGSRALSEYDGKNMNAIHVNLGPRSYDIAVVSNEIEPLGAFVRARTARSQLAFIVADSNTVGHAVDVADRLRQAGFKCETAAVPAGEESKCLAQAERLYDRLAELNADRQTLVVAVGGGVVGDLAGFVAATWNRGLPLFMIPTTLLAMVDSSVGGKVGINHPKGKNLIGAFHQPAGVWIDTQYLTTLPDREYLSGLAEVVKYGVILDTEFFGWLEANADAVLNRDPFALQHLIAQSCRLKARIVEQDEREESGLRMVLNYGHTFAHAFEAVSGYGTWLHGEAVAAGMICASRLAERLNLVSAEVTQRQVRLLEKFRLPTAPNEWPIEDLILSMRRDKKALAGTMRFVLPKRIGEVAVVDDVADSAVKEILKLLE